MSDRDFKKIEGQWFPIMNSLAEKLITYELTKIEHRVLWMFFRFCYGYNNSTCELGWSDMLDITKLPKSSLSKALDGLKRRNILQVTKVDGKIATQHKINSKLSTWKPLVHECEPTDKNQLEFTNVDRLVHKRELNGSQTGTTPYKYNKIQKTGSGDAAPDKSDELEKLRRTIWELTSELVKRKIFPEARSFVGKMMKIGKNERAVYHTLQQCYKKQIFEGGNAWGYAAAIMAEENGNYNERDHVAEAQRQKDALAEFLGEIGGV